MYDTKKVKAFEERLSKISILDLLEEFGANVKDDTRNIKCIFHDENFPSLKVNLGRNVWKCFSCGRGGGTAKLIAEYYKSKNNIGYYSALNKFLKEHTRDFKDLGFNTLLSEDKYETETSLEEIITNMTNHFNRNEIKELRDIKLAPRKDAHIKDIINYLINLQKD